MKVFNNLKKKREERALSFYILGIILGTLISPALVLFLEWMAINSFQNTNYLKNFIEIAWITSYLIPALMIVFAIRSSFQNRSQKELLTIIITAYFSIIILFGAVYYSMALAGDYDNLSYSVDRAFNGMDQSLFALENKEITFQLENRALVALDSLYLSVVTITTVGFGDITPNQWYSKIAVMIEALTGTTLLVLALGMVFSNWWGKTSKN
jgi:hypothetical protein